MNDDNAWKPKDEDEEEEEELDEAVRKRLSINRLSQS